MNKTISFFKERKKERAMWREKRGGADVTEDKIRVAAWREDAQCDQSAFKIVLFCVVFFGLIFQVWFFLQGISEDFAKPILGDFFLFAGRDCISC